MNYYISAIKFLSDKLLLKFWIRQKKDKIIKTLKTGGSTFLIDKSLEKLLIQLNYGMLCKFKSSF